MGDGYYQGSRLHPLHPTTSYILEQELMTTCEPLQQQQQLDACDTTTTPSQCQVQVAAADSAAALLTEQHKSSISAAALAASQQQVEDSRAEVEPLHSQLEAAEKATRKLQAASAHATAHLHRQNDSSLLQLQQQRASAAKAMLESRAAKFTAARVAAKVNSLEARLQQSRLHAEQQKTAAAVTTAALEAEQLQHSITTEKLHTSQEQLKQNEAALMQLQCGAASTQQALLKLQRTSATSIAKLQQQVDIAQHKEQRQRKVVASLVRCAAEAAAARFSVARLTAEKCSLQAQLRAATTYHSSEQTAQQKGADYQQSSAQATEARCQAALQQAACGVTVQSHVCLSDAQEQGEETVNDQGVKVHNSYIMEAHAGKPAVQHTQHGKCMAAGRCSCAVAFVLHSNSSSLCAYPHGSISPACNSISPSCCSSVDQLQHSRQWGSGHTSDARCSTEDSMSCSQDQHDRSSNSDGEEAGAAADCGCGTGTTNHSLGEAVGGESCDIEEEEEEEEVFFDAWNDGMGPCAR